MNYLLESEDEPFKHTVKAYKLFRKKEDKIYPLFVNANKPVPMGTWLKAESGAVANSKGQVKSKIGPLAYRPGWHSGDLPMATHIGGKSKSDLKKPDYRPEHHVWAEVEHPADKDWQSIANSRGKGVKAHITDQVPYGGHYRYKTNPNMTGNWIISGHMKVNRILHDDEVKAINKKAGTADLPRLKDLKETISETRLIGVKDPGNYSIHKKKQIDGSNIYNVFHHSKGTKEKAAWATLTPKNDSMEYITVHDKFQRKGIGSAIYSHIEKDIGKPLTTPADFTSVGKKLWDKHVNTVHAGLSGNPTSFKEHFYEARDYAAELDAQKQRHAEEDQLEGDLKSHYTKYNPSQGTTLRNYTAMSGATNNYLWEKHKGTPFKEKYTKSFENTASHMDSAVNRYKTPRKMTVWSKSIHDPNEKKDENNVVHHPAFLSTSINKTFVEHDLRNRNNVNQGGMEHHHVYKITVPKGHHGAFIPDSYNIDKRAKEFVLPRGSNLKHHSSDTITDNNAGKVYHTHHMEVI